MAVPKRARQRLELVAIIAVALAAGFVQHPPGDNETAHLALVKAALGTCSATVMVLANAVAPIVSEDKSVDFWLERARAGDFTETLLTRAGAGNGWVAIAPVLLLSLGALVVALVVTLPGNPGRRELELAAATVGAWLILLASVPELLRSDRLVGTATGAIGFLAALPFALVALPEFALHTKWSLLAAFAGIALVVAATRLPARPPSQAA